LAGKFAFAAFSAAAAADALVGVGGGERDCGGEEATKKKKYQDTYIGYSLRRRETTAATKLVTNTGESSIRIRTHM
jgi:hypothetical protein